MLVIIPKTANKATVIDIIGDSSFPIEFNQELSEEKLPRRMVVQIIIIMKSKRKATK